MMPQKKEEQVNPAWLDRAIGMFESDSFKDGDTVSHLWLKHALDIPEPQTLMESDSVQWMLLTRVDSFRDWLLEEKKVALQNVRGQGYRIIPPREQGYVAASGAMKAVKKEFRKADKLMANTRLAELNTEERKRHTDAHIRLAGIGDMMKKQRKDVLRLFSPK